MTDPDDFLQSLARAIGNRIRAKRSALLQESKIHDAIAEILTDAGVEFIREYRMTPADRLDFWLPGRCIAVEVKKGNAAMSALTQVARYLSHDQTRGALIIAMRITDIPDTFQNKPIAKIELWRHLL